LVGSVRGGGDFCEGKGGRWSVGMIRRKKILIAKVLTLVGKLNLSILKVDTSMEGEKRIGQ